MLNPAFAGQAVAGAAMQAPPPIAPASGHSTGYVTRPGGSSTHVYPPPVPAHAHLNPAAQHDWRTGPGLVGHGHEARLEGREGRPRSPLQLRPSNAGNTGGSKLGAQAHSPSRESAQRVLASHGRWLARVRSKLEQHEQARADAKDTNRSGHGKGSKARRRDRERAMLRQVGADLKDGHVVLGGRRRR